MKRPTTQIQRLVALSIAVTVVISAAGPVGIAVAQPTVTVSQTAQSDTTVAPGDTITVEATLDYSEVNSPGIDVTLPSGWTVVSHSDDGGTYGPPQPAWAWLEGDADGVAGSHTVTYTVQVPADATEGEYTISANGSAIDTSDSSFVTSTDKMTVTVDEQQSPAASAGADQTVVEGTTVALDASTSSDPDGDPLDYSWTVTDDAGTGVTLSDTTTAQPTFTAPSVTTETTLTFQVTVSDGNGNTDTDTVNVTVQPIDTQPSVSVSQSATSPTTVAPGESVAVETTLDYSDVNSPGINVTLPSGWTVVSHSDDGGTYGPPKPAWTWLEGDADGVAGSHTVTYTVQVPADAMEGEYTISANGSGIDPADSSTVADTDGLTVTVVEPTQSPTADAGPDQTVDEGATVTLDASGSADSDGSISSYQWTQTEGSSVTLSDTAAAQPTFTAPSVDSETTLTFQVAVTDNDGEESTDTVNVTVQPVETQPSVSMSQTATSATTVAPTETVTIEGTIDYNDVNAPAIDVTLPSGWTVVSHTDDGGTYGPPKPAWAWTEGDTDGVAGNHTVTYTVQVPGDASPGEYTISAEGSAIDPADDSSVADTDAVTVIVEEQNQAPAADAGADQTVEEGMTVTLDATESSDADGSIDTYAWTQTAGPSVSLSDATATQPTFTAPDVDSETTLTFQVDVTDDDGKVGTDTINVTVQPVDTQPSVSISQVATSSTTVAPNETIAVEATLEYSDVNAPAIDVTLPSGWTVVSHTDDGGTYGPPKPAWTWIEGDADGVAGNHTVTYTVQVPKDAAAGDYELSAAGSGIDPADDSPVTSTDTLAVTVPEQNQAPAADAGADQTVEEETPVTLDATGSSDSDGTVDTYAWTQTTGPSVSLSDTAVAQPTFTAPDVDSETTLTFQVVVTDDDGEADTDMVNVTVQEPPNEQPSATFTTAPADPLAGETVNFNASQSNDADGAIASYEWTIETASMGGETTLLDADFEGGSLSAAGWTHDAFESSASAGVNDATSNSGSAAAFHHGGAGALVSPTLDTSSTSSVTIEYWIQKGHDSFSENPDANDDEDLSVEYLSASGEWVEIDRVDSAVAPGATSNGSVTVDSAQALHDGFQLRFRQEGADATNGDYWHVDDVSVTAESGSESGTVTKSGQTIAHTFNQPGEYEVALTVTDDDGATAQTTQMITIDEQPTDSVPEAVASLNDDGDDSKIETLEIQQAIDLWIEDDDVPGTGGETISTQQIQQLIDIWVEDETIEAINGGS
ncbi:PKD domain-containing protein [Haloarcula amylovorans]|uniref:PKD domain-containing protein n=1 Tax=Haloarcula amylovorans TaxID=2562280 RepID=UPI0014301233|nr:PKD domain-containing protein [Halomicroarcula amylolytica]